VSLADRMRTAAETVEEASRLYGYLNPAEGQWSARRLREEAQHVESES
jgi:hypothetical protein